MEFIQARVTKVLGCSPQIEGGSLLCAMRTDKGTAVGRVPAKPAEGDELQLYGYWRLSSYSGAREFAFSLATEVVPDAGRWMLRRACREVRGLGEKTADALWDAVGDRWRECVGNEVRGLTPRRAAELRDAAVLLEWDAGKWHAAAWLDAKGLPQGVADAALARWGADAPTALKRDPYELVELDGVRWRDADSFAAAIGTPPDAASRMRAAGWCAVRDELANSETYADKDRVAARLRDMLGSHAEQAERAMSIDLRLTETDAYWTVCSLAECEAAVFDYAQKNRHADTDLEIAMPFVRRLTPSQTEAARMACGTGLCLITGGAGTGKTTVIESIVRSLQKAGRRVEVASLAGRAAARVKEATGCEASTIHRMLGYRGRGFTRGTMRGVTVVIDEASMVPSTLMAQICSREPDALVLVGDTGQLPPVGYGQPFQDLFEWRGAATASLTDCFRSGAAVLEAGRAIRAGKPPKEALGGGEEVRVVRVRSPEEAHAAVLREMERMEFDDDAVIAAVNGDAETPATVDGINAAWRGRLWGAESAAEPVLPGDRVMATRNTAEAGLWNGTVGTCLRANDGDVEMLPDGAPQPVTVGAAEAGIKPAYCLTVHKAQGSQYDTVAVVALSRDAHMMDAQWLYTAATRAKRNLIVITDGGDAMAAKRHRSRRTILGLLLKGAQE